MFSPEYNILKVAGSPLGYRHSEAAKKLIPYGDSRKGIPDRDSPPGNRFSI